MGSVASLLALRRVGIRPRRSGPEMPEPGPSGTEGETFCPSASAFQCPRSGPARGCPGGRRATGLVLGTRPGRLAEALGSGRFSLARPLGPRFPLGVAEPCVWPRPIGPDMSRRPPAVWLPAPCWQRRGRTAGAWGRSPRAAGSPQLLAPPKMTICHSIKVSGQLMGEPGSATPGQNGLLPRIGEVQMLNAEHCAPSQGWPPPGRRSGGWTAVG